MLAGSLILTVAWLQALLPVAAGPPEPPDVRVRAPEQEARLERTTPDLPIDPAILGALPPLKWLPVTQVTAPWSALKELSDAGEQLRLVERRALSARVANDLTPVTTIEPAFGTNLRRRDHWRGRVWARPELIAVLRRAAELLAERLPGTVVTVGDVAQEGGGQIPFGTQVRVLRDGPIRTPASDLLARAQLRLGRVELVEVLEPRVTFPVEASRFADFEDPVLVERRVTAVEGCARPGQTSDDPCAPAIRVETRRFWLDEPVEGRALKRKLAEVRRHLRAGKLVARAKMEIPGGHLHRATVVHGHRLIEVVSRKRVGKSVALRDVVEIRSAGLDTTKPGVLVRESRYLPEPAEEAGDVRLVAWRQLYEATHISHMGGLDADISYVMSGLDYHFTKEIGELDVESSRTWVETIVDAAEDVGVTVDRILVDPRVRWKLVRGMSRDRKKHPAWGLVCSSRGHDSHLHLRLAPGLEKVATGAR